MIEEVKDFQIDTKELRRYKKLTEPKIWNEIQRLSLKLKGKSIAHVNTTSHRGGGGVAEILHSLVPLMRDVGLDVHWFKLKASKSFFKATKNIHDTLQGDSRNLTEEEKNLYLEESKKIAGDFEKVQADVWIIHDPQPLLLPNFCSSMKNSILRIHIDLSKPNEDTWNFLFPHVAKYKKIIFSMKEYANNRLPTDKIVIFPPAIDPLTAKNAPLKKETARMILENLGLNPGKPIVAQISRFDVWKDPVGVVKAFYHAKKIIPDLQLVFMGLTFASDDPESLAAFNEIKRYAKGDPDIFAFYYPRNLQYDNNTLINAVQTGADVIVQKSIKEGFGLTVTEAMWKKEAVIGGNVGGIKLQIRNGYNGFLVSSEEECGARIAELIKNKKLQSEMGRRARIYVEKHFLLPRLLRDYLKIIDGVIA